MNKTTAKETVETMTNELKNLLAQKCQLQDQIENVQKQIDARRSALQGVQLGQKWQQEIDAENNEKDKKDS